MIRTIPLPRSIRAAAAFVGVAGVVTLAGCSGPAEAEPQTVDETTQSEAGSGEAGAGAYADGTYSAQGSYRTPETTESLDVTITLEGDVVTAVEVTGDPQAPQSEQYQGRFIGGISDEVVGKNIDELSVSRVAGSSLTSGGFNEALEAIKADAAA